MLIDHAKAIHTAMKQSIRNLEKWIHEIKETGNIDSFINAVYAQLCLISFRARAGEQILIPYLSTVIPKTMINYNKHTVDQPDCELDYEDDNDDNLENENISISPAWKENCFSWFKLICLYNSSSILLTQIFLNSKGL